MKEIVITNIVAIFVLFIYCSVTIKIFGKNFSKKNIMPKLEIPKNVSAMTVAFLNTIIASKIFHIGIFSLIEKNFIIAENTTNNKNFNPEILYKKNLEKSKDNYCIVN